MESLLHFLLIDLFRILNIYLFKCAKIILIVNVRLARNHIMVCCFSVKLIWVLGNCNHFNLAHKLKHSDIKKHVKVTNYSFLNHD